MFICDMDKSQNFHLWRYRCDENPQIAQLNASRNSNKNLIIRFLNEFYFFKTPISPVLFKTNMPHKCFLSIGVQSKLKLCLFRTNINFDALHEIRPKLVRTYLRY